ncbi:endocuticle structural glycoprotein SgAbd-3-like [Anabrus simplex]|uniref:endocuticle structural glycoprotein SgAbd-3-like n=1 Tax=Anabrus simplex TaxID=316456 RepID=UPI0034DCCAA2
MKLILVACLVGLAAAANPSDPEITIVAAENNVDFDGTFRYSFKNSDGTEAEQSGQLKQIGAEAGEAVQGSASYTAPDGTPIRLTYTADENGYQPQGEHLPVPPPIPEAIARALAYLATAPPPKEK